MILILMNMQYTMSWVAQPADIINCAKEKYTNIRYITGDLITWQDFQEFFSDTPQFFFKKNGWHPSQLETGFDPFNLYTHCLHYYFGSSQKNTLLLWIYDKFVYEFVLPNSKRSCTFIALSNLTITNWRLLWSLHVKPPRILGGHSKKIEALLEPSREAT